eukprot:CAMPEP_0168340752 /NCGR_PEP_ID=MMETSP0213-20121227/14257_1 /TAXON_ID=151035 /ORGANISM="Euplotes harpa, Strain FSP1.4" /LENGTH=374 /DNA_ID=CAMNT_0008347061 /DNA_START=12 /DNA_END=1136 /DNA_ORIENTATION=+
MRLVLLVSSLRVRIALAFVSLSSVVCVPVIRINFVHLFGQISASLVLLLVRVEVLQVRLQQHLQALDRVFISDHLKNALSAALGLRVVHEDLYTSGLLLDVVDDRVLVASCVVDFVKFDWDVDSLQVYHLFRLANPLRIFAENPNKSFVFWDVRLCVLSVLLIIILDDVDADTVFVFDVADVGSAFTDDQAQKFLWHQDLLNGVALDSLLLDFDALADFCVLVLDVAQLDLVLDHKGDEDHCFLSRLCLAHDDDQALDRPVSDVEHLCSLDDQAQFVLTILSTSPVDDLRRDGYFFPLELVDLRASSFVNWPDLVDYHNFIVNILEVLVVDEVEDVAFVDDLGKSPAFWLVLSSPVLDFDIVANVVLDAGYIAG